MLNEGCCGVKGPALTLTGGLIETAENLNEIRDLVDAIDRRIKGPEPTGECCDKMPWPPQLGLEEWIATNHKNTADILGKLNRILQVM